MKTRAETKDRKVSGEESNSSVAAGLVLISDYETLIADRPVKFTAGQVGFESRAREQKYRCDACYHFYVGGIAKRSVCEIYAPDEERRHVPPEASCRFWTADGESFPRLQQAESKVKTKVPHNKLHTVG